MPISLQKDNSEMKCYIYRSSKRDNCYLYVTQELDFSMVPDELMSVFGKPIFSMSILLDENKKYAVGCGKELKQKLNTDGFIMQMLTEDDFSVSMI